MYLNPWFDIPLLMNQATGNFIWVVWFNLHEHWMVRYKARIQFTVIIALPFIFLPLTSLWIPSELFFFLFHQRREKRVILCNDLILKAIALESNVSAHKKAESLSRRDGFWNSVCRRYNIGKADLNQTKSIYDFWRRNKQGIQEKFRMQMRN